MSWTKSRGSKKEKKCEKNRKCWTNGKENRTVLEILNNLFLQLAVTASFTISFVYISRFHFKFPCSCESSCHRNKCFHFQKVHTSSQRSPFAQLPFQKASPRSRSRSFHLFHQHGNGAKASPANDVLSLIFATMITASKNI